MTFDKVVRFKPKPDSPFSLSPEKLAEWFLSLHYYWFTDTANSLCGMYVVCREALATYLRTGEEPSDSNLNTSYVVIKFKEEAEDWFERLEN